MKKLSSRGYWKYFVVYVAIGLALANFPFLVAHNTYYIHVIITLFVGIMLAVSLRLILEAGIFSFAHATFMAIGAYTSVIVMTRLHWSFWIGLPLGMLAAGIVALLFARLALRVKGIFFGVLTIAFAQMTVLLIAEWHTVTGGWTGIRNVPRPDSIVIAGQTLVDFSSASSVYYLGLFLTLVCVIIMHRLDKSYFGRTLKNIAANDNLAESVGINTRGYQILAFVIGCLFAAMAGSFEAHYGGYITSVNFEVWRSIVIFIYVVVGGPSLVGAALGAALLVGLPEILRPLQQFQHLTYAVILILMVLFLRGGLISLTELVPRWGRRVITRAKR